MISKTMLVLLTVLTIGIMTIPAYAAVPDSPLDQYQSGVPIDEIQCTDDKILMQSTSGKPVCLTNNTSVILSDRGYSFLIFMEEENTNTISVNSLPITTTTEYPHMEMYEEYQSIIKVRKSPTPVMYSELGAEFTNLQGATGSSELTLPFNANVTRIGYLPDGMVVKYILHDFNIPTDSVHWTPVSDCEGFSYAIFPNFVNVNLKEIHSDYMAFHGGFRIGINNCFEDSWPDNPHRKYDTRVEAIEITLKRAEAEGIEVREKSYQGVSYLMIGKSDGTGVSSFWDNNGLIYSVSSEHYSMDELEKVIKGLI